MRSGFIRELNVSLAAHGEHLALDTEQLKTESMGLIQAPPRGRA
jgi:hypothetical protein